MLYLLLVILALGVVLGPQIWVKRVLEQHNRADEANFPGTASELARHLLDRADLQDVKVEATELGDHYDPVDRAVRLTRDKFDARTLTAITIAAHECGHAYQHAAREPMFQLRTRLASLSILAQRVGSFLLFAAPFSALVTRAPSVAFFNITGGILIMGFAVIMHLVTLPVEIDASFKKALPILAGGYLSRQQVPAARTILRAAAMTYVAASLASLLNFWRWMALLRR